MSVSEKSFAVVLVLYKTRLETSESFQTFLKARDRSGVEVPLIVYDNSPDPHAEQASLPPGAHYHHDPGNGGLVAAYNYALSICAEGGVPWLLLLDQDTALPSNYLDVFLAALPQTHPDCAALVPRVSINGRLASPKRFILSRPRLAVSSSFKGAAREQVVGINSGMFVRVEHLVQRGGYPLHYWLDAVDFWFCADAYAQGKHVFVLDTTVEHLLSIRDMSTVSLHRWESISKADADFTLEMRKGRGERAMAAFEGFAYAAFLLMKRHQKHARVRAHHAFRLLRSLV